MFWPELVLGCFWVPHGNFSAGWCDMSEWINCDDRLPELGANYMSETVLVFYGEIGSININCMMGDRWLVDSDEVTHWMPLPKPPLN